MAGFKKDIVTADHLIMGSGEITKRLGGVQAPLMPNGHGWGAFVPPEKVQAKDGLETMDCTVFGTLKSLITLAKYWSFTDFPFNCSERYNGIMANTTELGNSPHVVIENIRTLAGVVADAALPWTDDLNTWMKYYSPKPMITSLIAMGQIVIKDFTILHEWVFNGGTPDRPTLLKQALARGTVSASVFAWRENAQGMYYKNDDDADEHWIQIVDYVEGQYWEISDQYLPFRKKLVWNYEFECAKVYFITKKSATTNLDLSTVLAIMGMNLKALLQVLFTRQAPTQPVIQPKPTPMPIPAPKPEFPALIVKWSQAIARGEGATPGSHNPGNLKLSSLTASWGATRGRAATDGGFLCQFPDDATGERALCNFLVLGAENQLLAFHQARTLEAFTKVYAGNPPQGYIDSIAQYMGVSEGVDISTFLA